MQNKSTRIIIFSILLIILFIPLIANTSQMKSTASENIYQENNDNLYYRFWISSPDFTAPVITDVYHYPLNPVESDLITIGANVTDASGIYNVTLHYCVNRGLWMEIEMIVSFAFPEIYLVDIGAYSAGDRIQYYITAYDASGNWNEGVNDNEGLFYSFTILSTVLEFNRNLILIIIITLGLVSLINLVTKKDRRELNF